MSAKTEQFTSRFGLIAAAIGMAIGAGNIWRFPRLAGQYGGSFLVPWLIFLFLWSIPLLMVEFSIGKKTKRGTISAFINSAGERFAWMGLFVGFCTTAILFYYAVVCGWSLKYFVLSVSGEILQIEHTAYWQDYTASIIQPLLYHFFTLLSGAYVIYRGIAGGVEKFSKIVVPLLFLLLITAAIKAVTLPGAETGISYFFTINLDDLGHYKIWLEGLSQSAWSTGAGWGLLLTYAIYARKNEKIIGNSFFTGLGNNMASIIAGLAIIPTVFALSINQQSAHSALDAGNQGLAFITIPQLFMEMPGGAIFSSIFFLALFFAAMSSLISMIELATRIFIDMGYERKKAVIFIFIAAAALGAPSAISLEFFNNQDWVWGLGLMLSGFFFTFTVLRIGAKRFVTEWLNPPWGTAVFISLFRILFYFVLPLEFAAMLIWWFVQAVQWSPESWWNPFETFSLTTALLQWTIILVAGILLNKKIVQLFQRHSEY